jgi:hypothetical protein
MSLVRGLPKQVLHEGHFSGYRPEILLSIPDIPGGFGLQFQHFEAVFGVRAGQPAALQKPRFARVVDEVEEVVRSGLVEEILTKIPSERIIWEAPQKAQQVWFIKLLGANVNLGNIAPNEIVSLETIRLGLRGDTFSHFLDMDAVDPMFLPEAKTGKPGTSMPRG